MIRSRSTFLAVSALTAMFITSLAGAQAVYIAPPGLSAATNPSPSDPAVLQRTGEPVVIPVPFWPYTDFGKPGVIVSRHNDPLLGTTTIVFGSGTRLIIKPTKNHPGVVAIDIAMGSGRAGAPSALAHALWATALMPVGGTGKVSYADLDRWQQTSGKSVNITFVPGIRAYHLQGEVPATELETEMQLLTAYARDPGFRAEQAQKIGSIGPLMATQIESSPSSIFLRAVQRALLGSDSRYAEVPTTTDLAATTGAEVPELLEPALAGPADVTIVGDISFADAIAATELTIAAGADHSPAAKALPVTATPQRPGKPIIEHYASGSSEGWYGAYWRLADYEADPHGAIVAEVTAALIQTELLEDEPPSPGFVRPVARAVNSFELHDGSALGIALQIAPGEAAGLERRLHKIMRAIADTPISADALKNTQMMVLDAHSSAQKTNAWWLDRLSLVLRDAGMEPAMAAAGNITTVTGQEIQAFVQHTILQRRPIVVELIPAGA